MAVNLTNQNTWYVIATGSEYTTTLSGYTSKWKPQISARWTAVSGNVYTMQYKCSIVKVSGNLMYATSATNAYKIAGSGASTSTGGGGSTFTIPSDVKVISGSYDVSNGFNVNISGGVKIQNNGNTNLSGVGVLPGSAILPATPTVSASASSSSLINVSWGTTDLGTPAGTVSLYSGDVDPPTTLMYSKNTTGISIFGHDQRDANTEYFYSATATNTGGSVSSTVASAVTFPAGITDVTVSTTATTATFQITCEPSGNALTTTLQKSHNAGATWVDIATDVQGTTVTHTETNLTPETLYTAYFRVTTTAGSSASVHKSYSTQPQSKFYGSVNGQTKRVNKLYGSVNNQTKKIDKLYGSVNGVTKLIYKG